MDRIITITGIDPSNNQNLILSDQGTTNTFPGDQVTWVIGTNTVGSIVGINDKVSSANVFEPDPAIIPGTTSWMGTVNPAITQESEESYTIVWTTPGSGWLNQNDTRSFDPKIKVYPPPVP